MLSTLQDKAIDENRKDRSGERSPVSFIKTDSQVFQLSDLPSQISWRSPVRMYQQEASFPYLEMATCLLEFTNSLPVMVVRGPWCKVQPDNKAIPARCSSLNIGLDHSTGGGLTMESIGS